jgi:hypothetical protein
MEGEIMQEKKGGMGMWVVIIIIALVVIGAVAFGMGGAADEAMMEKDAMEGDVMMTEGDAMMDKDAMEGDAMMKDDGTMMKEEGAMMEESQ